MGLIKDVPIRHRLRLDINLTTFTDELHADVGADAFLLSELKEGTGHDWYALEDLVIRTAASGGGTLLVLDTDYVVATTSADRTATATAAAGSAKTIYLQIQITNAAYQTGDLYFSGEYWGDYADPEDLNNITVKTEAKSTTFTLLDRKGHRCILVTTGASSFPGTLPAASENLDEEIEIIKIDTGAGVCTVTPAGADTLQGATAFPLRKQWDRIKVKSYGTGWLVMYSLATLDSAPLAGTQTQTLAHGIGVVPRVAPALFVCTSGDAGYTAGEICSDIPNYYDGSNVRTWTVVNDVTNITTLIAGAYVIINHKSTRAQTAITMANWIIRVLYKI